MNVAPRKRASVGAARSPGSCRLRVLSLVVNRQTDKGIVKVVYPQEVDVSTIT